MHAHFVSLDPDRSVGGPRPAVRQLSRKDNGRQRGFTLIELMITVVIIGILASIAYPSYVQYVIRGRRHAAEAEMMNIANMQQQYFLANKSYAADTVTLGYTIPSNLNSYYTAAVAPVAGPPPGYTITFTGIGAQAVDNDLGPLILDNTGNKTPAEKW